MKRRLLSLLVLSLALGAAMQCEAKQPSTLTVIKKAKAGPGVSITGMYSLKYSNVSNRLDVLQLSKNKIKFYLTAVLKGTNSPRNGEISGEATLKSNVATYDEDGCKCTLVFTKNKVHMTVPDGDACGFGAFVTADGDYRKYSERAPIFDF